jgi:iron complex transport system substrate-binding protein
MTRMRWAASLLVLMLAIAGARGFAGSPRRVVSLIPAVTEMLFAMGEGGRLVGVSSYDRFPPEVSRIRAVGGLLDPSAEAILSLKPDLVVLYATQVELKERLERAGVPFFSYEHRTLTDITSTLRAIGARIESKSRADELAIDMERAIDTTRASVAGLKRPRTMLVFGREPDSLRNIAASGGYGFLHDMLEAAGGDDIFADLRQQSVQVSTEMILARQPDVIVELRYGGSITSTDARREIRAWENLASVPAVRAHRVYVLVGDEFVVPGPRVVDAIRRLARTLHPEIR